MKSGIEEPSIISENVTAKHLMNIKTLAFETNPINKGNSVNGLSGSQVGPKLKDLGLVLVGLDVIGDYLTEINVTSPTGVLEIDRIFNLNCSSIVFDALCAGATGYLTKNVSPDDEKSQRSS